MNEYLLEPIKGYKSYYKEKIKQNATELYDSLLKQSEIDLEQNRVTSQKYREAQELAATTQKRLKKYKVLRVLLIICAVIGGLLCIGAFLEPILLAPGIPMLAAGILLAWRLLTPKIKKATEKLDTQAAEATRLLSEAKEQVAPLCALFRRRNVWDVVEKTLPELNIFDSYSFPAECDFVENYDFTSPIDREMTVTDVMSGALFSNPFVFNRYVRHRLGEKLYTGSLVIHWTETYRDSKGHMRTRTRTQTLTATLSKPCPYYDEETILSYGSQAAPKLRFSRSAAHHEKLSDKDISKLIKKGERGLSERAEKSISEGGAFQPLTNTEFEVLFGALDRDNEIEFRVMYTPLAQNNVVDLVRNNEGYGDDFNMLKTGKVNIISSEHMQRWLMDTSPAHYLSYDADIIKENFIGFVSEYFRSVYFDIAPLLCVPAYQREDVRSFCDADTDRKKCSFSTDEYETLANMLGQQHFAHPNTTTRAVLKADQLFSDGGVNIVRVTAYSYRGEDRVDFVPVLGGDGRTHAVPVPWVEYIPLENCANMAVKHLGIDEQELSASGMLDLLGVSAYKHGLVACPITADTPDIMIRTLNALDN